VVVSLAGGSRNLRENYINPGILKVGRHLLHLGVVVGLGLFCGVLNRGERGVGHELGVLLEEVGIEREREKFARTADLDFSPLRLHW